MSHPDRAVAAKEEDGSVTSAILPKDRRVGKYQIVGLLGKGGMGVVYRALDPFLEREVAIKVMLPQLAEDPEQKQRFEREARAVARLNHPNVVMVFDLGYHTDGAPYIVMELLQGDDLLHITRREPALRLEQKVAIVLQVLDGLGQAHKVGIVHRDVKPANVFVSDEGTAKIMDFGIARLGPSGAATGSGTVVGTANYMSPEQVLGHAMDGRSDLFSVGSMLCELLTGRRPFEAEAPMATLYLIAHKEPVLDLPQGPEYERFRPVLAKALAKDPSRRFATGAEFADALAGCIGGGLDARRRIVPRESGARPAAPPEGAGATGPLAVTPPSSPPATGTEGRPAPRRPDPTELFRILRDVYVGGRSGRLHFASGPSRRSLCIRQGRITHAISDTDGERLGEVLVRYGVISQGDMERALESEKRLGPVLSGLRLLDREKLGEGLGLHAREILFAMLEGTDGSYSFEESAAGEPESEVASTVSTGQVILEATRRVQDPELVRRVLGDQDRILVLSSDPLLRFQRIALTPTDGFVLSRVDGTLSARDVISLSPVAPEDTERSLFGLLCTGIIDHEKERTSRTRPTPSVGPKPPDGDTRPGPATGGTHPVTARVPASDGAAASRPKAAAAPPQARERPPEGEPRPAPPRPEPAGREPADVIREAEGLLAQGRFSDAVSRVEPVVGRVEGPLRTRASVLLARAYLADPERRGLAEAVLLDLVRLVPDCTPAYFFLGTLYRRQNQPDRARSMYRKALELEPEHRGAKAELKALGDDPGD